ncbi:hypothetical protein ES708_34532 [subsurface metagenome]
MEKQLINAGTTRNPSNWQKDKSSKSEKLYTKDELIKWYLQGRKDAIEEEKSILLEKLGENIKSTQLLAEEFINDMDQAGIKSYKVHLRINSIKLFDLLFVVDKNDFNNDKILTIYKKARSIKNSNKDYRVEFSFLPFHPEINPSRIASDGYLLSYGTLPKSRSSKA